MGSLSKPRFLRQTVGRVDLEGCSLMGHVVNNTNPLSEQSVLFSFWEVWSWRGPLSVKSSQRCSSKKHYALFLLYKKRKLRLRISSGHSADIQWSTTTRNSFEIKAGQRLFSVLKFCWSFSSRYLT